MRTGGESIFSRFCEDVFYGRPFTINSYQDAKVLQSIPIPRELNLRNGERKIKGFVTSQR